MKKQQPNNITLKLIALVLAVITWFYISAEMSRSKLVPNTYSPITK